MYMCVAILKVVRCGQCSKCSVYSRCGYWVYVDMSMKCCRNADDVQSFEGIGKTHEITVHVRLKGMPSKFCAVAYTWWTSRCM